MKSVTSTTSQSNKKTQAATKKMESPMISALNDLLADEFALFMKTLNYHWNVEGPQFSEIHKFLDEQYRRLLESVDLIAERVRAIGGRPLGTLAEILDQTTMKEVSSAARTMPAQDMLQNLLEDYNQMIESFNEAVEMADECKDFGTNDLLAGLIREYQKHAWMLKAYTTH